MYRSWSRFKTATWCLSVWLSLAFAIYFYVQRGTLHSARIATMLQIGTENWIPFLPAFVWIYITIWPAMVLPFYIYVLPKHLDNTELALRFTQRKIGIYNRLARFGFECFDRAEQLVELLFGFEPDETNVRKTRRQIMIAYFLTIALSAACYYYFPLRVERPKFDPVTLTLQVLARVYYLDKPNSIFPSLHASFAFLIFFIFNRLRPGPVFLRMSMHWGNKTWPFALSFIGALFYVWACLIILSTYFVKQHMVIDGIAGFFLAFAVYRISFSEWLWRLLSKYLPDAPSRPNERGE